MPVNVISDQDERGTPMVEMPLSCDALRINVCAAEPGAEDADGVALAVSSAPSRSRALKGAFSDAQCCSGAASWAGGA